MQQATFSNRDQHSALSIQQSAFSNQDSALSIQPKRAKEDFKENELLPSLEPGRTCGRRRILLNAEC
jgi:hypothetical protein